MTTPALKDLLSVACEAAYLGGRRALAYFNAGVSVETKADKTPVTQADREAELVIRAHIAKYFPDHAILGEEHGATEGNAEYRWIIDPIDGTKTFIQGVPFFGALIGVEVRGAAAVGVMYMPALDEMLCAATGLGCQWNGRPARVSKTAQLSDAVLLTTAVESANARSSAYAQLAAQARLSRTWGDCYGYALVATGRADIMLDPEMNLWDTAPLLPIIQEAGGRFTSWDGRATIRCADAVATNGLLHEEVLSFLKAK